MFEWNQNQAIEFCQLLEPVVSKCGGHIGLTGGCLYKPGFRKDVDVIIYNHTPEIALDMDLLEQELLAVGVGLLPPAEGSDQYPLRIRKALYNGSAIDFFFLNSEPGSVPEEFPEFEESLNV